MSASPTTNGCAKVGCPGMAARPRAAGRAVPMWMSHPDFGPELAWLLRRRRYADAVGFWKSAKPLAQMTVTSAVSLAQIMETDPPCLAFLTPRELEEIQIAAGFSSLVGATRRMGRFVDTKLRWPHQLSKDAAVQNLISAFHTGQFVNRMLAERHNNRIRVRVQNSCEGACITCLLASSRDFPIEHCPPVPIVGCVNFEKGCRCSIAVTAPWPELDSLSRIS